jgi:hypothetical protein
MSICAICWECDQEEEKEEAKGSRKEFQGTQVKVIFERGNKINQKTERAE